jgi:4'-phosphopantetheinyl transferase
MQAAVSEHSGADTPLPPWTPGPQHPRLAPGAVHVWRVDLTAPGDELLELLSPAERERAKRPAGVREGQLWAYSRAVLRALLARYLQTDPRGLRFAVGKAGKPALANDASASTVPDAALTRLSFNLSHSAQTALYAFAAVGAVGVDVEVARRPIDAVALAGRVFGPVEAARLRALDAEARDREFLRAWVRHEAALKCLGVGLGGSRDGETVRWISELEMGSRAAAAVAVAASPSELRCWDWSAWDQ